MPLPVIVLCFSLSPFAVLCLDCHRLPARACASIPKNVIRLYLVNSVRVLYLACFPAGVDLPWALARTESDSRNHRKHTNVLLTGVLDDSLCLVEYGEIPQLHAACRRGCHDFMDDHGRLRGKHHLESPRVQAPTPDVSFAEVALECSSSRMAIFKAARIVGSLAARKLGICNFCFEQYGPPRCTRLGVHEIKILLQFG